MTFRLSDIIIPDTREDGVTSALTRRDLLAGGGKLATLAAFLGAAGWSFAPNGAAAQATPGPARWPIRPASRNPAAR